MGMMDTMMGGQMPQQAPPQGGMMGSMMGGSAAPQDNSVFIQMADTILQNPSPQVVTQVIDQLHQMGGEGTAEVAQALQQVMGNPQELVRLVQQIRQALG